MRDPDRLTAVTVNMFWFVSAAWAISGLALLKPTDNAKLSDRVPVKAWRMKLWGSGDDMLLGLFVTEGDIV